MTNVDDLYNMAGGSQGGSLPKLPGIRIDGNNGDILLTHLDKEKDPETNKYPQEKLEGNVDVIFIKVRRKLMEGNQDGIVCSTSEHNTTGDVVKLYQKDGASRVGLAQDFRDENDRLKTEQIVYALYNGNLVRVSFKGTSLREINKTDGFYGYLQKFNKDKPFFFYKTRLSKVQSDKGYYGFRYQCSSEPIDEATKEVVIEKLKEIHAICEEYDAGITNSKPSTAPAPTQATGPVDTPSDGVQYPDDEIDPDDIPF